MQLQAISIAAWELTRDLRRLAAVLPRRLILPKTRCRAPQQPWRLCVPPGVPDALPFAYRYEEPGTVDAIGPRVP